ncbi:hypothetical protein BDB00DRAFT_26326 [Zychaea mexicana]|uniref:uncharacterized protein n=1 Tax=Zychaea mexicana TaxID=64656 RepID=UPI0022FE0168|nr:uncharacterized protein BDB00DRAFT_26326 [Zychaea mexicana]KAI9488861.1 hypothetical protein BDB00DRAFT_26326 [Zychaea mexicana]
MMLWCWGRRKVGMRANVFLYILCTLYLRVCYVLCMRVWCGLHFLLGCAIVVVVVVISGSGSSIRGSRWRSTGIKILGCSSSSSSSSRSRARRHFNIYGFRQFGYRNRRSFLLILGSSIRISLCHYRIFTASDRRSRSRGRILGLVERKLVLVVLILQHVDIFVVFLFLLLTVSSCGSFRTVVVVAGIVCTSSTTTSVIQLHRRLKFF